MIPTGTELEDIKKRAVEYLWSINQRWPARVLEASSLQLVEDRIVAGEMFQVKAFIKSPTYIEENKVPEPEKEWVQYYIPIGIARALNQLRGDDDIYHHVSELIIEWNDNEDSSIILSDKDKSVSNQGLGDFINKTWSGMRFGSEDEIRIAKILDQEGVMFFPNCMARLNIGEYRGSRSPDFLVCHGGKWGILEVDGPEHKSAAKDHDRDRLFKAHGIRLVEHFTADECRDAPHRVVKTFLELLAKS